MQVCNWELWELDCFKTGDKVNFQYWHGEQGKSLYVLRCCVFSGEIYQFCYLSFGVKSANLDTDTIILLCFLCSRVLRLLLEVYSRVLCPFFLFHCIIYSIRRLMKWYLSTKWESPNQILVGEFFSMLIPETKSYVQRRLVDIILLIGGLLL